MKKTFLLFLLSACAAWCAELPHIGYLFPAGGVPGTTFEVTVGGQYLKSAMGVYVSGAAVTAEVVDYTYELDPKARNRARNMKQKMEAALEKEENSVVRDQIQSQIDAANDTMMMAQQEMRARRKNPEMYAKKQFNPQLADTLTLQVTIADDVKPGEFELRVVSTNGLSNHLVFHVSELPEVFEAEPNDDVDETVGTAPELPLLLNGQVMPGDVDCFRFYAKRGRDLVFQVQARSLVPYLADAVPGWFQAVLTLYDAQGKEIAYIDDFRFDPDPVLICQVPKDGEYILEIRDSIYRGRRDFVYRIAMGRLPFIDHIFPLGGPENSEIPVTLYGVNLPQTTILHKTTGDAPEIQKIAVGTGKRRSNARPFGVDVLPEAMEVEPNNLPFQAQSVEGSLVVNGRVERSGDADCFRFEGRAGEVLSVEVLARRLDSPLDARLVLLDPEEHILAVSDDEVDRESGLITHHADALLRQELPETGTYIIRLDDLQGKGGHEYAYRLRIGKEQPDFSLRVVPASLTIPEEGSAVVTVHALRKAGFTGAVELSIKNAPDGFEINRAVIPAGQDEVQITLSATDRKAEELMALQIQGQARIRSRTVRRTAVPAEDMMQAFLYRHLVPAQELLVRVTEPQPVSVKLKLPAKGIIQARPGDVVKLSTDISYAGSYKGSVQLILQDPPEWASLGQKSLKKGTKWGREVKIKISEEAKPGTFETLVLTGKISISKPKTDPTYNPILKWMNREQYNFTIGAIPVQIIE